MSQAGAAVVRGAVVPRTYRDSIELMRLASALEAEPGVRRAAVLMATPANRAMLVEAGLGFDAATATSPDDLIVAVLAGAAEAADAALGRARELLAAADGEAARAAGAALPVFSLGAAVERQAGSTLAIVSTPGPFAAAEALKALKLGLDVFLFSDNVALADEVALKAFAARRGRLVMGPDCGTAILGGVPLGFANVVRSGPIGLIGASGTGLQQVACLIDRGGSGISHAIGVGGRDLSAAVGGASTLRAIELLAADPATRVLVVISKPPAAVIAERVLAAAAASGKPVVACFVGRAAPGTPSDWPDSVRVVATLDEAACAAVALVSGAAPTSAGDAAPTGAGGGVPSSAGDGMPTSAGDGMPTSAGDGMPTSAGDAAPTGAGDGVPTSAGDGMPTSAGDGVPTSAGDAAPTGAGDAALTGAGDAVGATPPAAPALVGGAAVRGLFAGGTLAYEAAFVLGQRLGTVALVEDGRAEDVRGHAVVDLGADAFTRGRAHPMIDPRLRNDWIVATAADPTVGALLIDVVLGHGAHADPVGALMPALGAAHAARGGRPLAIFASVCGTPADPQSLAGQEARLRAAGVLVCPSNAAAARRVAELVKAADR